MFFLENIQNLIEDFKQEEIAATVDARNLHIPGIWITPNKVSDFTLTGVPSVREIEMYGVIADYPGLAGLSELDKFCSKVTAILFAKKWTISEVDFSGNITLPSGAVLPCFKITVTI